MVKDGDANEYEEIDLLKIVLLDEIQLEYFINQNTEVNLIKNITIFYK